MKYSIAKRTIALALLSLLPASQHSFSLDGGQRGFDFFIIGNSCKNTIASISLSTDKPIKTKDGDPPNYSCWRDSGTVSCFLEFESGDRSAKGDLQKYEIIIESGSAFYFGAPNGSEIISVNITERAAVVTSRVLTEAYAGAKVCHGAYLTASELQALTESSD